MGVIYKKKSRRQFLVGAGQMLALPLLPSLLPQMAQAQALNTPPRTMLFHWEPPYYQGHWIRPEMAAVSVVGSDIGAKSVALKSLPSLSSVSSLMTSATLNSLRLKDQMTLVRGFDLYSRSVATGTYGSECQHMGYTLSCDLNRPWQSSAELARLHPSIDSLLEKASSVYPIGTSPAMMRAVRFYDYPGGYSMSKDQGLVRDLSKDSYYDSLEYNNFYDRLFRNLTGGTTSVNPANTRKADILSKILVSFNSVKSGRRIGAEDKQRLQQHMDLISDVQRGFASASGGSTVSCTRPAKTANFDRAELTKHMLTLLAIAFKCDATRVGIWGMEDNNPIWIPGLSAALGGRHFHDSIHGVGGPEHCALAHDLLHRYYINLIADNFLVHLDTFEGNTGRTYLDNMIVSIVNGGRVIENAPYSGHSSLDSQQIVFGSMGGKLKSGSYYRLPVSNGKALPLNCFLITLAQLAGMKPADYAYATQTGNGIGDYVPSSGHPFAGRFYQPVKEILNG